jgi:hypothetical protein
MDSSTNYPTRPPTQNSSLSTTCSEHHVPPSTYPLSAVSSSNHSLYTNNTPTPPSTTTAIDATFAATIEIIVASIQMSSNLCDGAKMSSIELRGMDRSVRCQSDSVMKYWSNVMSNFKLK